MIKTAPFTLAIAALAMMATSCSKGGWTVEGTVENGADSTLFIEGSTASSWYVIDSVKPSGNGSFSFTSPESAAIPSIYRLRMGEKYIYFPVDSIETVTVEANASNFDRGYSLAGNSAAPVFARVDSLINASVDKNGASGTLADSGLKQELNQIINRDSTCLVSYYIIGKFVGNRPLYNLTDRNDLRILGNAANNFQSHRPADPRTTELRDRWTNARRALGLAGPAKQMEATVVNRPTADIKRYDMNGKMHDFEQVVTRGGVTILNFTRYDNDYSPANTLALKKAYDTYKPRGLEIYQIAFDPDEMSWKRSAANMPWISVWNSMADPLDLLVAYNVDPINGAPVSFVFNANGELVARATNSDELMKALAPLF